MEFSSPKIKKIPILSRPSPQNFSLKNVLYFFLKNRPEKISSIFSKKVFPIFQEMELSS